MWVICLLCTALRIAAAFFYILVKCIRGIFISVISASLIGKLPLQFKVRGWHPEHVKKLYDPNEVMNFIWISAFRKETELEIMQKKILYLF